MENLSLIEGLKALQEGHGTFQYHFNDSDVTVHDEMDEDGKQYLYMNNIIFFRNEEHDVKSFDKSITLEVVYQIAKNKLVPGIDVKVDGDREGNGPLIHTFLLDGQEIAKAKWQETQNDYVTFYYNAEIINEDAVDKIIIDFIESAPKNVVQEESFNEDMTIERKRTYVQDKFMSVKATFDSKYRAFDQRLEGYSEKEVLEIFNGLQNVDQILKNLHVS